MKTITLLIGLLALAMGILWIGQGLGYIKWPASSFMISQTIWSYYGAALAVGGLLIIWWSRR
jgi:uncharacterized membrane protein